MKEVAIKYKNDEITVVWKPKLCIHSEICWKGLDDVFKPLEKSWIKMEGAPSEKIIAQVNLCPSGALNYLKNKK